MEELGAPEPTAPGTSPGAEHRPVARVAIDTRVPHLDRLFDYEVPAELEPAVRLAVEREQHLRPGVVEDETRHGEVLRRAASQHGTRVRGEVGQALATEVTTGAVTTELRFWSGARQLETREARDAVIRSVLRAFTAEGIPLASDVITVEAGVTLDETVRRAGQARSPEDPSADTA